MTSVLPSENRPSAIEIRVDLCSDFKWETLQRILHRRSRPSILLTVRSLSQGGKYAGSEDEREAFIARLLALEPEYFDIEWNMRPEFIQHVFTRFPKTRIILSHHDFQGVPRDLEGILRAMEMYPAYGYKIAAMTHTSTEALRLLLFAKKHPNLSVICMGEAGEFARVLGPIAGNKFGFAAMEENEKTGPGQFSAKELSEVYHYHALHSKTAIYGLIGDPVSQSPGHLYHNEVFRKRGVDAVYVKMRVRPEELEEFMSLAAAIGIRGLSVTIPLKEAILPFVDRLNPAAAKIGAVNTLMYQEGRILGTNTDGVGALEAIENKLSVFGKRVVIIGAGGAARAIACEAKARGGKVLVLNRTLPRAQKLASEIGCEAGELHQVPCNYDLLVNCSPDPMPIDPDTILPESTVMDVVYYPRETPFLKEALSKGCRIVYGDEMFLNQAAKQTAFWIGS